MIKRIVKLTFREEAVPVFLEDVFEPSKERIRAFPGCRHMELLRNLQQPNVLFTLSIWENEAALENVDFSVSAEKRSETVNNLSRQALKNFTARAQVLSDALGFGGRYKIVNINIQSTRKIAIKPVIKSASAIHVAD